MTMKNKATAILGITIATCGLSTLGFSEPAEPAEFAENTTVLIDAEDDTEPVRVNVIVGAQVEKPEKVKELEKKLRTIVIPAISFEDTTIEDAIEFLRQRSAELDTAEQDPAHKGINFFVKLPRDRANPTIRSLKMKNVPIEVVLEYICEATEMNYEVTEHGVISIK